MGQFSAGPVNKAVLSFKNSSTEYMKADRRRCEHFSVIKDSHFQCLRYLVELGQLKGSVKEPNILIYFFFSAHHLIVFRFRYSVYWWKGSDRF